MIPKGLKKDYARKFPDRNLHHIIPRSRGGPSTQFNLYPYERRKTHPAYHDIFWNMKVNEVWVDLKDIHYEIFYSNKKYIYPFWISVCALDIGTEKEKKKFEKSKTERLAKDIPRDWFVVKWLECFGSESVDTARKKLKEMMLYMVFGVNMLDDTVLFNNGNLLKFLEASPCSDERLWAFQTCFGKKGCSIRGMKSKISKIIKTN